MKTRNFPIKLLLSVILLFICIGLNYGLYGQSLKKTFKYIENNEIDRAESEIQKFTDKNKKSEEDNIFFNIALCLLKCNERYSKYDPYSALELFKSNMSVTNEFLNEYNLDIGRIQNFICQSILKQAKKLNSEESYQRALNSCPMCLFENEVMKLKEQVAYNNAKNVQSISVYKKFLSDYPKSSNFKEIHGLLEELSFQQAKQNLSIPEIKAFIKEYSNVNDQFTSRAKHLIDSISFFKLPKNYFSFRDFADKNPNSEYRSIIIKELPDLLYTQAFKLNNIDLYEKFCQDYPKDVRIDNVKKHLEDLSYFKLKQSFTLTEYEKFKNKFPNSLYSSELNKILENLMLNSDLKKFGLLGTVKRIETINFDEDFQNPHYRCIKIFNSMGKLSEIHGNEDDDKIKAFENKFIKNVYENDMIVNTVQIGGIKSPLSYFNTSDIRKGDFEDYYHVKLEYNNNLQLVWVFGINRDNKMKWNFLYDNNGKLVTKDIYQNDKFNGDLLLYKIKYKWQDDKLISRKVYTGDGKEYESYDYLYANFQIVTNFSDFDRNHERITNVFNTKMQNILYSKDVFFNGKVLDRHTTKYSFTNDFVTLILNSDRNGQFKSVPIIVGRDSHGMITSISNCFDEYNGLWEYRYDSHGNWIERTQYRVIKNDIEVKTKINYTKRNITYYE